MIARAVLLAALAASAAAGAQGVADAPPLAAFTPPEGPVLITRTVERSLVDGKEVRATRHYLVSFHRDPDGWRLEGALREVRVDVPPLLEQFAALERNRAESSLFPLHLDPSGRLMARNGPLPDDGTRTKAVALGEMMIGKALRQPDARNQANVLLAQVAKAGSGGTAWPLDLFNPAQADSLETRSIATPDGIHGSIAIIVHSEGFVPGRLPRRVERTVVTDLGGSRRTAHEIWTFEPTEP